MSTKATLRTFLVICTLILGMLMPGLMRSAQAAPDALQ